MKIPSEKELDRIRRDYPVGTIIEIQKMDDPQVTIWVISKCSGQRAAA